MTTEKKQVQITITLQNYLGQAFLSCLSQDDPT